MSPLILHVAPLTDTLESQDSKLLYWYLVLNLSLFNFFKKIVAKKKENVP